MTDTTTTKSSISPDTRVKMPLKMFIFVVVSVFGFAVANTAAWNNVNSKLDNLVTQNSLMSARLDKLESNQIGDEKQLLADERQADHFSDWIKNRLNIKTNP